VRKSRLLAMAPLLLASGVKRKADTKAGAAEATSGSQQSLFLIVGVRSKTQPFPGNRREKARFWT